VKKIKEGEMTTASPRDATRGHRLLQEKIVACARRGALQGADPSFRRWRALLGGMFVVEGTIGAGKTTLGKEMARLLERSGLGGWFGKERVNAKALALFYDEMKRVEEVRKADPAAPAELLRNREAYGFQTTMLSNCQSVYQEAIDVVGRARHARLGTAVLDRGVFGNAVFAAMHYEDGNLTDKQYDAYLSLMEDDPRAPYLADCVVYVDVAPGVAWERIRKLRCREGEDAIPLAYLENLERGYYFQIHAQAVHSTSAVIIVQNDSFVDAASVLDLLLDDELPELTRRYFASSMPDPAREDLTPQRLREAMEAAWRDVTLPRLAAACARTRHARARLTNSIDGGDSSGRESPAEAGSDKD
jgi:deoxyadenosine/deoxycytidine kinase